MNTFLKAFALPVLLTGAMSLMLPSPADDGTFTVLDTTIADPDPDGDGGTFSY